MISTFEDEPDVDSFDPDEWMSFDDWTSLGYHIKRGERSTKRDKSGVALFSSDQVSDEYDDTDN